ncbi:iron complex transport system substrate-binding protein [Hydrogenophaga palleronii]|uniref:Iron complex transport system substrate-binding protein n=1 Tax=Hydrogenophaga palleronii TaxID=65655 RepID=A0ABU1WHC5_9BURK|nr:helical backbone metal receptor [Hydrogenophaga palleronii]MDR7148669.1 iron complex transport system substrate-binding protein [Hydrogenophaga palleronii]
MTRPLQASVPALAALGLLSCFAAVPAHAQHRIVTLSPSLTEAVCALGHCAQLVGTDRHSTWPGGVGKLPKVGGLQDAQIEHIVALRPDMVLLGPRSRAGERLTSLGVPVQVFDARTHADLKRMLLSLGDSLGEQARAAELVQRIESELDAASRRVLAALRGRSVYVEVGIGPTAASAKSFIGETVARLGLVNIVSGEQGLFPRVNPEMVVRRSPDLIIGPMSTLASIADRPAWVGLPALRRQQVCRLDTERMDLLSRPGPRLGEAAHMLVDCLLALPPLTH